jgi:hypothetical protein
VGTQHGPEGRNIEDGDALNVSETEKIVIGRHEACGMTRHGAFQEFVVVWISASADAHCGRHKQPSSTDQKSQCASLGRGEM